MLHIPCKEQIMAELLRFTFFGKLDMLVGFGNFPQEKLMLPFYSCLLEYKLISS